MSNHVTRRGVNTGIGAALISPALTAVPAFAQGGEPIKIGFGMALTGPLAPRPTGAAWRPNLGRRDQCQGRPAWPARSSSSITTTSPIRRPFPASTRNCSMSTKSTSSSAPMRTNMVAPAIPVVMQKGKVFIGLFALDANGEFQYPKYFSMTDGRSEPEADVHRGLLPGGGRAKSEAADRRDRGEDAEFSRNAHGRCAGQREESRLQDRLRPDLPAEHDRLLAGHPCDSGDKPGSCGGRLVSARRRSAWCSPPTNSA